MDADDFETRLRASGARLAGLAPRLTGGGPWPLAARFDHAPEASWGPPEILAHVEEMLAYWLGETERVVDMTAGPVEFGRMAEDDMRLAVIARDRTLPMRELVARVWVGIDRWLERWTQLDESDRARSGLHPTLGELRVADVAPRFVAGHLEAHLDQLDAALSGEAATG